MKTHYLLVHLEATESGEEISEIACGLEVVDRYTQYDSQVTCKNCIKVMNAMFITSLVRAGNGIGVIEMTNDRGVNQALINDLLGKSKNK